MNMMEKNTIFAATDVGKFSLKNPENGRKMIR